MVLTPYLELHNVNAYLGERRVFNGLNLELNLGEQTAVLGPNGAGKSALVKLISRSIYPLVEPGSSLKLFGSSTVNLWALRRRIGLVSTDLQGQYIPQVRGLDVVLSGWFGSVGLGRDQEPTAGQRQRTWELMEKLSLVELSHEPFGQLSEGQRRRLLIARALVHKPEVLVLDEPTNALDLKAKHQLLDLLRQLAQNGTTLLLVTHQIEAIVPEISRCVLLNQGQVVGDGASSEVLQSQPLSDLFGTPLQVLEANNYRQVLPR
ncbi:MAG: molybdenum ABC transporter ATP-binding protein [Synechococcus sp. TMED19]|nr:MAG: molybdenum ABC transporter ATP-binding protein [Synechococcus sp. TMED19]